MSLTAFPTDPPQTKEEEAREIREVKPRLTMLIDAASGLKASHVAWLVRYTLDEELPPIKHALDECYALLAPVLPGSKLVLTTPRNERVKGTVTRVGTRIVKANMHLQLQTFPAQTLTLRPKSAIHIPPLVTLTTKLNEAIKTTSSTFDVPPNPSFLAAQLRLLSHLITTSIAILKGTPVSTSPDYHDTTWTVQSCPSEHLEPDPGPGLSCHFSLADSFILLTIRTLEPAHAPVALGTKLGLAIGTVRRIEHDEVDKVFQYVHHPSDPDPAAEPLHPRPAHDPEELPPGAERVDPQDRIVPGRYTPVFVREKVRVETADPKLMSLLAKLNSLKVTLARVEANLATVLENNGGASE